MPYTVIERNRYGKTLWNTWTFDTRDEARAFVEARKASGIAGPGTDFTLSIKQVVQI